MNVKLTPAQKKFIAEKIRAGQYGSPDELVRNAVDAMRAQEEWARTDVKELRREAMIGIRQLDRGEFAEFTSADTGVAGRKILAARKRATARKAAARRKAKTS